MINISSLIIYGSCARGTNTSTSDVDLLSITSEGEYRMVVQNKINLALYPRSLAIKMAKNGELFMLHIVREGRPLIDFNNDFEFLQSNFEFKKSYSKEIEDATNLGGAILQFGSNVKNKSLVNKRLAWCVRTITIAKAAEQKLSIFSAVGLSEFLHDKSILDLIENKNNLSETPKIMKKFEKFLHTHGSSTRILSANSLLEYKSLFNTNSNIVGSKTIDAFISDREFDTY
ncbi:nucleotidyltransferase domain-containing protein [Hydrogenophaga sp. PAMC20947]|uniref:anti-phage Hailong system nucleotidyltransferase HalB n=1 Tax=Hydrogenophaga sp. PAMC20947 TaxID=2565558 RepID=UPI00109E1D35|nr:nucleotidyltransferase domain-containing protein [Hydrogenophaga sp. PAMC20947]QCB46274.1 nucleotidyltransferase domain-containing protein [Hydrogenophaga sp. PAMC20947]